MKRLLSALALLFAPLALLFAPLAAHACPTYPYTLTNGQTADANQVMANFTSILNCVNTGLATSGTNSNITALVGLTTPLSITQGGTGSTTASGAITNLGGLVAFDNLADLTSASSARTNLGLGGAATLSVGTAAGTVAAGNDSRFVGPTQNSQSAAYGIVLSDGGGQVYHPSSDTTARTWTIPANSSVAFQIGAKIDLVNDCSAGAITLAITSDTLVWFPTGSTGTRTLGACGEATITKVSAQRWIVVGVGLS